MVDVYVKMFESIVRSRRGTCLKRNWTRSQREMVFRSKVSSFENMEFLGWKVFRCTNLSFSLFSLFQITRLYAGVPVVRRRLGNRIRTNDNQLRDGSHEQRRDPESARSRAASDSRWTPQETAGRSRTTWTKLPDENSSAVQP